MKRTITIPNIETARNFVAMTAKYPFIKLNLNCDDYSIDAHSIIGILSLDLSKPLELDIDGEISNDFVLDLEPYTV